MNSLGTEHGESERVRNDFDWKLLMMSVID